MDILDLAPFLDPVRPTHQLVRALRALENRFGNLLAGYHRDRLIGITNADIDGSGGALASV